MSHHVDTNLTFSDANLIKQSHLILEQGLRRKLHEVTVLARIEEGNS